MNSVDFCLVASVNKFELFFIFQRVALDGEEEKVLLNCRGNEK